MWITKVSCLCVQPHWLIFFFLVATVLSEVPTYKYTFTLMIKLIEYKDTISSPLMGKVATSLVSNNRLFKSIKFLEQSPLRKFILQPKVEDYVVSNVPVTQLVSKVMFKCFR